MPVFRYTAVDAGERVKRGFVEADTARAARDMVKARSLVLLDMAPAAQAGHSGSILERIAAARVRDDLAMAVRQLATLLKAGIPLADSLTALVEQIDKPALNMVFRDVRERITQGLSLQDALSAHPAVFDRFTVEMARVGEASGSLDSVLLRLSDHMMAGRRTRAKVTAALIYPALIVSVGVLVVSFLVVFVVPNISKVLVEGGKVLPLPTQVLVAVSDFVRDFWWMLLIMGAAAAVGFKAFRGSAAGRLIVDKAMLSAPLLGPLLRKHVIARFAHSFATLLKSGMPALEALKTVGGISGNEALNRTVALIHDRVIEGHDIAGPVRNSGVFPPLVAYMIGIGEQTGRLEEMLDLIASHYEEEVDFAATKLTRVIEPLVLVALAIVVGFIVLSIVLPILELSNVA